MPAGCPIVLGGGIVRDAILGGRPGDIDIWLPSNISVPNVDEFMARMTSDWFFQENEVRCIFSGPGAHGAITGPVDGEYGDVGNHWVLETEEPEMPKINIMRSFSAWSGDSQAYFDDLMQRFDIDACMMFIGIEQGNPNWNHVIIPLHLYSNLVRPRANTFMPFRFLINELHWNQGRVNTTSQARFDARLVKMRSKYSFSNTDRTNRLQVIPTAAFVATPVPLSLVMRVVNQAYGSTVRPTPANAQPEQVRQEA